MSQDQRLEYLATTKDEGNKRLVPFCGERLRESRAKNLTVMGRLDFRFAH